MTLTQLAAFSTIQKTRQLFAAVQVTLFSRAWNYIQQIRILYSAGHGTILTTTGNYSPGPGTLFNKSGYSIQQTTKHTT
ncbi:hypothetical protein DPMN_119273 [Dreissena polymorpha]|uniref:Uncharacterized protein n=1 Tax=Dreissena polymorpha TaxID=45954 RepID=A0A9D4GIY0_DREPO|nr:hypothetical protein DPMN_119273 [Dreissena polymorpha]